MAPQPPERSPGREIRPRVREVAATLRARIAAGEYDGRLLKPNDLLAELGTTLKVLSSALRILKHERLIESRPGIGTRVRVPGQVWKKPTSGRSLADHVTSELRRLISDGTYPAGSKLPHKSILAAQIGVGQTTLHAGMAPLKDEGLLIVTWHPRFGTYVRQPDESLHP